MYVTYQIFKGIFLLVYWLCVGIVAVGLALAAALIWLGALIWTVSTGRHRVASR